MINCEPERSKLRNFSRSFQIRDVIDLFDSLKLAARISHHPAHFFYSCRRIKIFDQHSPEHFSDRRKDDEIVRIEDRSVVLHNFVHAFKNVQHLSVFFFAASV